MNLTDLPEDILRKFSGFKLNMVNKKFLELNENEFYLEDHSQCMIFELNMYFASIRFFNMSGIFIDTYHITGMFSDGMIEYDEAMWLIFVELESMGFATIPEVMNIFWMRIV